METPEVGAIIDGYRFNGGDPADPASWEQVSGPEAAGLVSLGGGWWRAPDGATFQEGRGGALVQRTNATNGTAGGGSDSLTEAQARATLYGGMMAGAERDYQAARAAGYDPGSIQNQLAAVAGVVPFDGDFFGRLIRDDQSDAGRQAELRWAEANLRQLTGAAATNPEIARVAAINFDRGNDSLAEQRYRTRSETYDGTRIVAGPGAETLPEYPGARTLAGSAPLSPEQREVLGVSETDTDPRLNFPTLPGFGGGDGTEPPGSPNNPFDYDALDLNQRQALPLGAHIASRNEDGTYRLSQYVRAGFTDQPPEGAVQRADGTYEVRRNRALGEAAAFASGAAEQIPFGDEIAAGIVGTLTGEGYDAIRQFDRERDQIDRAIFGGARNAGGVTGGATGLLLPGGQIMNGTRGVNALARGAGLGAGYGALYGAGAAEDGERLSGAVEGGIVGGITGGLAEPVGAVVGRVGTAAGRTVDGWTGGRLGEMVASLTNGAVGGADNGARARMMEALRRDGFDGPALQSLLQRWQQNGGTDAALIDLVTQNGGGQNFMSLVRASALRGGGASAAARQYRGAVEGGATDEALNLTRGLTPDNRSAPQVRDDLVQDRSRMADQQYREPYRTVVSEEILPDPANRPPPVDPFEWFDPAEGQALIGGTPQPRNTLPPNVRRVLEDSEGARAVGVAMRAAIANSDDDLVRQLRALRQGDDSVPITARALDRIRIAFREMAEGAAADQRGSLAAGLRDRVDRLDGVLDDLPELRDARAAYRAASQRIEGVDLGAGAYSRSPGELTDQLTRSPAARDTFGLGLARDIEGAIGRQGDGATGLFNRLATAPNSRNALAQAFGPERGAQYQNALGQIVDRVRTARAIDPGFGSQTAQRGMDALIEGVAPISGGILTGIMRKLNEGLALTDAEREIVVRYATSMPDINVLAQRFTPSRAVLPRPLLGAQVGSQSQ